MGRQDYFAKVRHSFIFRWLAAFWGLGPYAGVLLGILMAGSGTAPQFPLGS